MEELKNQLSLRSDSYAQEGEDMILQKIFHGRKSGFFVDVGAHHPIRFSNTFRFYKQGWRGINIDPLPGSMQAFNALRPKDINLELAIAIVPGTYTYFMFREAALNTLSADAAATKAKVPGDEIEQQIPVEARTLSSVLEEYMPSGVAIDLLTIDAEGLDLEVLQSNNWKKFRPEIVLVEALASFLNEPGKSELYAFMQQQGYVHIAQTFSTAFFRRAGV